MDNIPDAAKALLEDSTKAKLLETIKIDEEIIYYIVEQSDEDGGEPVFLRVDGGGNAEVTTDIKSEDQTAGGEAAFPSSTQTFLRAYRGEAVDETDNIGGGAAPLSQTDLNKQFLKMADKLADIGFSSANAPGTDGGNLACAWAVNQCAKKGLGTQIGGGLATANMRVVLREKHDFVDQPVEGAVVISASATVNGKWTIGHVGVIGKINTADEDETPIYSNSSSAAKFMQNFTLRRWREKYRVSKGLRVEFFQLKPSLFPNAGNVEV